MIVPIIEAIDKELIKRELTEKTFLRTTNKAGNELYVINNETAPNTLREIGRLREVSFRPMGSGSGKECDLDHFDLEDKACYQLIVWNPELEEIIGGYRFTLWKDASFHENGQPYVNTEHLFDFSEKFIKEYMPYTIEMARAFVIPKYQKAEMGIKSLFALDNLWDGIGALVARDPENVKYLAGKVSVYSTSKQKVRNAIFYYLKKFYGDKEALLVGKNPVTFTDEEVRFYDAMFIGADAKDNYKILNTFVREEGAVIPPLIHSYIELSSSLRTFGTMLDPDFGDTFDTAIIITIKDIYDNKRKRYIDSYKK